MFKKITSNYFLDIIPKKYYSGMFLVPILVFFGTFLEILNIGLIIPLLSSLFGKNYYSENLNNLNFLTDFFAYFSDINSLLIFLLFLYFIKSIFIYFQNFFHFYLLASIRKDLTVKLLNNYLSLNYLNFKSKNSNVLLKNLTEIISQFTGTYLNALIYIIVELSLIIFVLILLILINYKVVLIILFLSSLFTVSYIIIFKNKIRSWGEFRVNAQGDIFQNMKEALTSFVEIKIYKSENLFLKKILDIYLKFRIQDTLYQSNLQLPKILFEFLAIIILIIFIKIGYGKSLNFESFFIQLSIFAFASIKILPSLSRLNSQYTNFIYSKPNLDLLKKELSFYENSKQLSSQIKYDFNQPIILKNISFKYNSEKFLNDINLSIPPNKITSIVGKSGSGKSTISKIIMGLLKPENGELTIGSSQIKFNDQNWYKNFSIVSQDLSILDKNILENITFISDINDVDMDLFNLSLKKSGLLDFVNTLEDTYFTIIGDMGSKISGGQKQRIQIARAIYNKAKILILDEATSSVDVNLESIILKEIFSLKSELTIIFITHKLENLSHSDYIYEINNGELKKIDKI